METGKQSGGEGKINLTVTTDGSKLVSNNP